MPLSITQQPSDRLVYTGTTAQYFVTAAGGTTPYTYQWYETTAGLLAGETQDVLNVVGQLSLSGNGYYCIVTDGVSDTVQSDTASLTVTGQPAQYTEDIRIKRTDGVWVSIMGDSGSDLINDSIVGLLSTWSSQKIAQQLSTKLDATHTNNKNAHHDRLEWQNKWAVGTYLKGDIVRDDSWTMVANKNTTDRAAPQPIGNGSWTVDITAPGWSVQSPLGTNVVSGNSIVALNNYLISGVRIYIPVVSSDLYYRAVVAVYNDPDNPDLVYSEWDNYPSIGWVEKTGSGQIVSAGTRIDVAVEVEERSPGITDVVEYNYTSSNGDVVPGSGEAHRRLNRTYVWINKTPATGTITTPPLPGTVITTSLSQWNVNAVVDQTTYWDCEITGTGNPADGLVEFTISTPSADTPQYYYENVDYWLTYPPTVSTVAGFTNIDGTVVLNDSAYGADLYYRPMDVSEDWDIMALAGGGSSKAVDGTVNIASQGVYYAKAENGFVNRSESTISFDDATRTFTISPVQDYVYYHRHRPYIVSTDKTVVVPDVEALYYIYFEDSVLKQTDTFTPDLISDFAFVAVAYWDAENATCNFLGEERHGNIMDSTTHTYNHLTLGARFETGFALENMTVDASGDVDSHAQFSVSDGIMWDEDIRHIIQDGAPQTLSTIAEIPLFYRSGATGLWRKVDATTYPITTAGTGRAAYNEDTGATWQLTEVPNNDFVLMHYYATNEVNEPIVGIVGQALYTTKNEAELAAAVEINNLAYGQLSEITPEFVPIATVIYQTSNVFTNAVKSKVVSTADGGNYIDWRSTRGGVGV